MNNELKTNIITTVFAITCLILYLAFPFGDLEFENWLGMLCVLFILPILYSKIILHKTSRDIGFGKINMDKRGWFFLASSVIVGGLISFLIISMEFGRNAYIDSLSPTIATHFGAFMFYELIFMALSMFLFTFFSFGFIYSIKYKNEIFSKIFSIAVFIVFLADFYISAILWIPLLAPVFFIKQIRYNKNIIFMFLALFIIALMIDTLVIKSIL
ncbi:MAG: hypothetical protein ACKUBY_02515 [Candidatus Moraniibacteriota bacterium]|jgi:hypothetical protein